MHLGLTAAAARIGGHRLPQHQLTHLPIHPVGHLLVQGGAAGHLRFDDIHLHRLGNHRAHILTDMGNRALEGLDILIRRPLIVLPQPDRVPVTIHERRPARNVVVLDQEVKGRRHRQPAPDRQPGLQMRLMHNELTRQEGNNRIPALEPERPPGSRIISEPPGVSPHDLPRTPGRRCGVPEDFMHRVTLTQGVEAVLDDIRHIRAFHDMGLHRRRDIQARLIIPRRFHRGLKPLHRRLPRRKHRTIVEIPLLHLLGQGQIGIRAPLPGIAQYPRQPLGIEQPSHLRPPVRPPHPEGLHPGVLIRQRFPVAL